MTELLYIEPDPRVGAAKALLDELRDENDNPTATLAVQFMSLEVLVGILERLNTVEAYIAASRAPGDRPDWTT